MDKRVLSTMAKPYSFTQETDLKQLVLTSRRLWLHATQGIDVQSREPPPQQPSVIVLIRMAPAARTQTTPTLQRQLKR